MFNRHTLLFKSLLLAALLFAGCDKTFVDDSLDEELTEKLTVASGGQGLSYFKLPDSNDYINIPQDALNPISQEKVALGRLLFHETGLLLDAKRTEGAGTASCASCHHAAAGFQAGIIQGIGEGGIGFGLRGETRDANPSYPIDQLDVQPIRTPSALNAAYQRNQLWNGQFGAHGENVGTNTSWTAGSPKEKNKLGFEGVETQAIAGQGVHRLNVSQSLCATHPTYKSLFAAAFPLLTEAERPTAINAGKAIAAYERTLLANQAPFQEWLRGNQNAMNAQEKRGAILFFGKAQCVTCHTGPALNTMAFYGLGMNDLQGEGTYGTDISKAENRGRGGFTGRSEDLYKFKVPQLYNLADSPFYGHGGSFRNLKDVVIYKNKAIPENTIVPTSQLAAAFKPLGLTEKEVDDLTAFLQTALQDPNLKRYVPSALPSGQCFPVNDGQARQDLNCK